MKPVVYVIDPFKNTLGAIKHDVKCFNSKF